MPVDGTWFLSCDDTGFQGCQCGHERTRAAVASWIGAVLMIIYWAERSVRAQRPLRAFVR
jgi:hypothetical protein